MQRANGRVVVLGRQPHPALQLCTAGGTGIEGPGATQRLALMKARSKAVPAGTLLMLWLADHRQVMQRKLQATAALARGPSSPARGARPSTAGSVIWPASSTTATS